MEVSLGRMGQKPAKQLLPVASLPTPPLQLESPLESSPESFRVYIPLHHREAVWYGNREASALLLEMCHVI